MILCIGTTPAVQRVMVFRQVTLDAVNRALTTVDGVAGKSVNVAKVLQALGEQPVATGFLGGGRGEFLRSVLKARGIELDFVTVQEPTRQCTTVIDQSAGTQTELVEESRPVAAAHYQELTRRIRRRIKKCRAVVMSGTITPGGPVDFYLACGQMAREAGAMTVVDAQGLALIEALGCQPGLVKPNRSELAATVGRKLTTDATVLAAMQELRERGAERTVVTAGSGPVLAFDGRRAWRILPPRIEALNPIGSGDAVTAGLVWRLLRGDDLGQACRWGVAAGAANALTVMAGEVELKAVKRLVRDTRVEPLRR
jgi:tagatose 6-phosphate kinase